MNKGKTAITLIAIFLIIAVVIGGVFLAYNNKDDSPDYAAIIASMEKEINKNVETITELEQTLELNGLKLEDLTKTIVEYETIIDDRTKTQKVYIERKDYITRTLTDKQTIYDTKTQEKVKIVKEIEILTETLNNTDSSETETITEIQEKIVELEKEKVVVEKQIEEVEKVIVEYQTELVEVEEKINVLTININQLNKMITDLNVQVNLIGKTEDEVRELTESLYEQVASLEKELAYAKAEVENLKNAADSKYQNIIDNLNNDIKVLNATINSLENHLANVQAENISYKQKIIDLENEIEELKKQILNSNILDSINITYRLSNNEYMYFIIYIEDNIIKDSIRYEQSAASGGVVGSGGHIYNYNNLDNNTKINCNIRLYEDFENLCPILVVNHNYFDSVNKVWTNRYYVSKYLGDGKSNGYYFYSENELNEYLIKEDAVYTGFYSFLYSNIEN